MAIIIYINFFVVIIIRDHDSRPHRKIFLFSRAISYITYSFLIYSQNVFIVLQKEGKKEKKITISSTTDRVVKCVDSNSRKERGRGEEEPYILYKSSTLSSFNDLWLMKRAT